MSGVGVDEDLHVEATPDLGIGEDEDPFDDDHGNGSIRRVSRAFAMGDEVVDGRLDRRATESSSRCSDEQSVVEGVGVVEVDEVALVQRGIAERSL